MPRVANVQTSKQVYPSSGSVILVSRLSYAIFLLVGVLSALAVTAAPLHIQTYRADANGFNVASVLVMGKTDAVLIDAQYTQADAHRVVADVLASGKRLTMVYVSQGDPDYYFGLEVIKQAFPDVRIFATQPTIDHIKSTLPEKLKIWGPQLGANGPKSPIVPDLLPGHGFTLEGQDLQVIGLDGPSPLYSFIWIPSIRAVMGGVRVFGNMHLWTTDTQTAAARQCWIDDLRHIESLGPMTVVPGHAKKDTASDLSQVRFSKQYLTVYGEELAKSKDSSALIRAMKQQYPDAIGDDVLELGAKVNKGEIPWVSAPTCSGAVQ